MRVFCEMIRQIGYGVSLGYHKAGTPDEPSASEDASAPTNAKGESLVSLKNESSSKPPVRWETLPFESLAGDLVSKPPVRWETL